MIPRAFTPSVWSAADEADMLVGVDRARLDEAFVERLAELGAAGMMLDIGTGAGTIPLRVCERFPGAHVAGIDLSVALLGFAERRRRTSPHLERVEFRVGNAEHLDFDDSVFDAVFCNEILHRLADPRRLLGEMRRVLRPGGVLLVRDFYRPATLERLEHVIDVHLGNANERQRALLQASLCAALTPEELRAACDGADLGEVELALEDDLRVSLQIGRGRRRTAPPK